MKDGIFHHLIDVAAFIDVITLSQWENCSSDEQPLAKVLSCEPSFPIGGKGRIYCRAAEGQCFVTGNLFQQRWGRARKMPRIPDSQLCLRSVTTPVSCAETNMVSSSLLRRPARSTISQLELTFDIKGSSVDFFVQCVKSRGKTFKLLWDNGGRKTFYICTRRSSWQTRIYDKAPGIVRIEFIFRRGFLRKHGINQAHELLLLRNFELDRLVWLRELDPNKVQRIEKEQSHNYRRRAHCWLAGRLNRREFAAVLRDLGATCPDIFVTCAIEKRLRRMLRRLFW